MHQDGARFSRLASRLLANAQARFGRFRSLITCVWVWVMLGLADWAFINIGARSSMFELAQRLAQPGAGLPVDFAPSTWLSVLALVLGTLIIVISISSQSVPKLITFYSRDWLSLAYLWFIIHALMQSVKLQFIAGDNADTRLLAFFNTYALLPCAILIALPYIFYILNNTRTTHVIQRLHDDVIAMLDQLHAPATHAALESPRVVREYQVQLFEALNQLDDVMHYTPFKEPKALAITRIGSIIRHYLRLKEGLNPTFFRVSAAARQDISFITVKDQWANLEEARSFFELKGFRVLANYYSKLLEENEFELASLCAAQFVEATRVAGKSKLEEGLLEIMTVQFNTLVRFAIKDGHNRNEARHLFNLLFFYRQFIIESADAGQRAIVERACNHLKFYTGEIYRYSQSIPAFRFLVDVAVSEMRTILMYVCAARWPVDDQARVLQLLLSLDNISAPGAPAGETRTEGVRVIQTGLALYYLEHDEVGLAEAVVRDFVEHAPQADLPDMARTLRRVVDRTLSEPEIFWEVTDRGNRNLYHAPEKEQMPQLLRRIRQELARRHNAAAMADFDLYLFQGLTVASGQRVLKGARAGMEKPVGKPKSKARRRYGAAASDAFGA